MNVKPLLRRGAFAAAMLVVTSLVAADLSEVADLKPLAMKVYGIRSVERKGDNTLAVTLGASSSVGARRLASAWRVTSPDDPAYAYSKFVKPASVAEVSSEVEFKYPDGMAEQKKVMPSLTRTVVELKLPTPMKKNCKYAAVAYGAEMEVVTSGRTGLYAGEDSVAADLAAAIVGLRRVSSVGEGKLLCEFGAGYSPAGGNSAANWKVTVNGKPRPVLALGRRSKIDCYVPKGWGGTYPCLMQHDVFLDIGDTLKTGDKVAVEVTAAVSAGARDASFAFDESKSVSRSIQANQVGYLPDGNVVSLVCEQRKSADEKPVVRVTSTRPIEVVLETCADASQAADDVRNLAAILRDMRKDVAGLNLNVGYPGKFLEVPNDVPAKRVQKFATRVVDLRRDGELYDVGEESTGYVEAECASKPTLYFGESKAEAMNENPAFFEQTNLVVEVKSGVWRTPLPLALRYFRFKGEQPKVVRFIEEIADVKERVTFSGTEREMAMHKAALRTLRLCMREFLIDGVKRDRLPWAGDLTVSLLANAASYRDAEIVKRTLVVLDSAGWKAGDINGIVDYSLWHVISHDMFQENFGDLDFLREQYPNIAGRLESFVDRVSESGLIDGAALKRNPTWLFIDWTGSKLESTTALNMIYYGALQAGARLADRLGEKADAERWRERAHSVKAALMAKAWDSERGLFRFSVDEDGAKPGHFTRHGNIYAVIFGVAGDSELKSIGAALAGEELPPVGTPYVAAYEAKALIRCGRKADARRLIEKVWGGMLDAGATSFWEGFDANEKGDEMLRFYGRPYGKSLCHAWSSAPVFLLPMLKEP